MSHKFLELVIKYTELDFNLELSSNQLKKLLVENNLNSPYMGMFVLDPEMNMFWFRLDFEEVIYCIRFSPEHENFIHFGLVYEIPRRSVKLSKNEYEDIKNNFIIDGKLNEIDFVLAYGKNYSDEFLNVSNEVIDIISSIIEMLDKFYSNFKIRGGEK